MFPNTPMQAEQTQGMQTAIYEQEITALFARGQADMARQLEVTTIRLDKAVETVAMGEARIAAQIASFERMANEMRRAAEEHDRGLRGVIESFQRGTAELANEALRPLKAEIEGMSREVPDRLGRYRDLCGT
jgi:ABC-type transporter Mla subunit MlaD